MAAQLISLPEFFYQPFNGGGDNDQQPGFAGFSPWPHRSFWRTTVLSADSGCR
jgi:hypothetical protein